MISNLVNYHSTLCFERSKEIESKIKLKEWKYILTLIVTFNSCHITVTVYHYAEIYTQDYSPV